MSIHVSRRRLILFLLLSMFVIAQVTWWIILQVRIGGHISAAQHESWAQQIVAAQQWVDAYSGDNSADITKWLTETFPDLQYDTETGSISIRDNSVLKLEDSTSRIIRMILSEGAFFSLVVIAGLFYMYWTLRREAQVERHFSSFLAATTHELKTPITAMRLFADALKIRNINGSQIDEIQQSLDKSLNRLDLLIDKLLQARGKPVAEALNLEWVDLGNETETAIKSFTEIMGKVRSARINFQKSEGVFTNVDVEQWGILVNNLVENGLKYSPDDQSIEVQIYRDGKWAVLKVTDYGSGFLKSERKMIFQRFYRTGEEDTRKSRGSGIGLYLVNEITRSHGGKVTAFSDGAGKGSTFTVKLPFREKTADG